MADLKKYTMKQLDAMFASIMPSDNPLRQRVAEEIDHRVKYNVGLDPDDDDEDGDDDDGPDDKIQKALDDLIKGGKRAVIGEQRMFAGRLHVKTQDGWKFVGKGTGTKAQAHVESHNSKHHDDGTHTEIEEGGLKVWKNAKGEYHRDDDKPAMIYADGTKAWYKDGKTHRDGDKPAIVDKSGKEQQWFQNGVRHRDNGKPAIIESDGKLSYFINGRMYKQAVPKKVEESDYKVPAEILLQTKSDLETQISSRNTPQVAESDFKALNTLNKQLHLDPVNRQSLVLPNDSKTVLNEKIQREIAANKDNGGKDSDWQCILNVAYDDWQNSPHDLSYEDMVNEAQGNYGDLAAFAILLGKYGQQVNNGGHSQYHGNGYSGDDHEGSFDNAAHKKMLKLGEELGFFDYLDKNSGDSNTGTKLKKVMSEYLNLEKDTDRTYEEFQDSTENGYDDDDYNDYYDEIDNENYGMLYGTNELDKQLYSIDYEHIAETFISQHTRGAVKELSLHEKIQNINVDDFKERRQIMAKISELSTMRSEMRNLFANKFDTGDPKKVAYHTDLLEGIKDLDHKIATLEKNKKDSPIPKVKMELVGTDSNIFAVLGKFQQEAKRSGWTSDELSKFSENILKNKNDYNSALAEIVQHVE